MPKLDGKETLKEIRRMEQFSEIPIILFSTSSMPQDKAFAAKHGAGYITKPLVTRQMVKIVNQFIDHCTSDVKKVLNKTTS